MVEEFTSKEFGLAALLKPRDWRRDTRIFSVISLVVAAVLVSLYLFGAPPKLPVFGLVLLAFGFTHFYSHKFRMIYSGGSPWDRLVDDWSDLRSMCKEKYLCDIGDSPDSAIMWGTKRSRFLLVGLPVVPYEEGMWQDSTGFLVAHYCDFRKRVMKKSHWMFLRHIYVGEESGLIGYFRQLNSEIEESLLMHANSRYIEKAPDPVGYEPLSSLAYQSVIKVEVIEL